MDYRYFAYMAIGNLFTLAAILLFNKLKDNTK